VCLANVGDDNLSNSIYRSRRHLPPDRL